MVNVLYTKENLYGIESTSETNILWPCKLFNVSIEVKKSISLNILDITVLKLIDLGYNATDELSQMLAFSNKNERASLIKIIKQNLSQKEFLKKGGLELTDIGKRYINQDDNSTDNLESKNYLFYFDLINNEFLNIITEASHIKYCNIISSQDKYIQFSPFIDNSETIKAEIIQPKSNQFIDFLHSHEVSNIIKTYNKNYYKYKEINNNTTLQAIQNRGKIISNGSNEKVYINCKLVLDANKNPVVTTGFNLGYEPKFSDYLQKYGLVDDLRKQQITKYHGKNLNKSEETSSVIYKLKNKSRIDITDYNKLIMEIYQQIERELREKLFDPKNDERKANIDLLLSTLSNQEADKNMIFFRECAEKINLHITKENEKILKLSSQVLKNKQKDLKFLLLCTIYLKIDDKNLFVFDFTKVDFLLYFIKLIDARNNIYHGANNHEEVISFQDVLIDKKAPTNQNDVEILYQIFLDIMEGFSHTGIKNHMRNPQKAHFFQNDIDENAQIAFKQEFLNDDNLSETCKNDLISIMREKQNIDLNKNNIVIRICSILQNIFLEKIKNMTNKDINKNTKPLKKIVVDRLKSSNIINDDFELPKSLLYVSDKYIKDTLLYNKNTTLGANFLVFLYLASETHNLDPNKYNIDLINYLDTILTYRGHGNNQNTENISHDTINNLLATLFQTIKTITN